MKTFGKIITLALIIIAVTSCGKPDKKAQLEKLIKQRDKLTEQIATLEKELKNTGSDSLKIKSTDVLVTEITPATFDHFLEVQGKVDGEQNVGVMPQVPGLVTSVYVKEGSPVRIGQTLAQLDDALPRQQLTTLQQGLDFATTMFEKQKGLWEQGIGTEVQYLQAKNQKESLEKQIATVQEQIAMYKIKSPINGTVEEVNLKVGQMASAGVLPSFRVVNFSSVKVYADIAESYAPKVKAGNKAIIYFPDYKKEIPATVNFSSKYINPTNRTFQIEARLAPGSLDYRANMIASVRINDYHAEKAVVLPVNAIKETVQGKFVYVAVTENGKTIARKRNIEIGQTYNGMAEVISGLSEGDKVITTGQNGLTEGQPVKISSPVSE